MPKEEQPEKTKTKKKRGIPARGRQEIMYRPRRHKRWTTVEENVGRTYHPRKGMQC
jgi:hypothetical protein